MKTLDELALEVAREMDDPDIKDKFIISVVHRLVEKLAKQEPVAWFCNVNERCDPDNPRYEQLAVVFKDDDDAIPLYAAPIVKESVTEEEPIAARFDAYTESGWINVVDKLVPLYHTDTIKNVEPLYLHPATITDLRAAAEKLGYVVVKKDSVEKWYLGSQNDALYIINTPPAPSNDYPQHDNPNGATMAICVYGLPDAKAEQIVQEHNKAMIEAAKEE